MSVRRAPKMGLRVLAGLCAVGLGLSLSSVAWAEGTGPDVSPSVSATPEPSPSTPAADPGSAEPMDPEPTSAPVSEDPEPTSAPVPSAPEVSSVPAEDDALSQEGVSTDEPGEEALSSDDELRLMPMAAPLQATALAASSYTCNSPSIINQSSMGTLHNVVNKLQYLDVTTGAVTNLVDLTATFPTNQGLKEELNGLSVIVQNGEVKFYFTSHYLTGHPSAPVAGSKIFEYNATTGALREWATAPVPTGLDDNLRVRRGAVDPTTGFYYYSTSNVGTATTVGQFQNVYALDPRTGYRWFVGTIETPTYLGQSGDMTFDSQGNMYLVTGGGSTAYVWRVDAWRLPRTAGGTFTIRLDPSTDYLNQVGNTGNGVGIAYGNDGYLYISNTAGDVYRVDPMTGATVSKLVALGGSSATVDLASCVAPNTLTVQKNVMGRAQSADQFTLTAQASVDGGKTWTNVGQSVTTTGTATGLQPRRFGPYTVLIGTTTTFKVSEVTARPADYLSTYTCRDLNDPAYVRQGTGTSVVLDGLMPRSGPRALECTFTNTPLVIPVTVGKTVISTDGAQSAPGAGWTMGVAATGGTLTAPSSTATNTEGVTQPWQLRLPTSGAPAKLKISEVMQNGYRRESLTCTQDGKPLTISTADEITVGPGGPVHCQFTNRLTPATVTVQKLVQPVGSTTATPTAGWTMQVTRSDASSRITAPSSAVTGTDGRTGAWTVQFDPADTSADLKISETLQTGYEFANLSCTGGGTLTQANGVGTLTGVSPGANVVCTYTNRQLPGTATWTKIEKDPAKPLGGSEWILTGPGLPAGGLRVADCVASTDGSCTGPDKDSRAGQFRLDGLVWGDYTLVESRAPAGYELDATPHRFTIGANQRQIALGSFTNQRRETPALPLTGGLGRDFYSGAGAFVLGFGLVAAATHRRRTREVA